MATARQEALALIAAYGAQLIDMSGPGQLIANVDSPAGRVWQATGCHLIAVGYLTDRPAGWRSLLQDLRRGVDACTDPGCDYCTDPTEQ